MRIQIEAPELAASDGGEEFVNTTVAFAAWHYDPVVEEVRVGVEPVAVEDDALHHRCTLTAHTRRGGTVAAGATGGDPWEAVQEAANLLEAALFRPPRPAPARRWRPIPPRDLYRPAASAAA